MPGVKAVPGGSARLTPYPIEIARRVATMAQPAA
jgi:hypothetical protein